MKHLINYKLIVISLILYAATSETQAQFGKKLKALGKKTEEATEKATANDADSTQSKSAPEEVTKFYSEIESTDNFREKELNKFGSLYDFQSSEREIEFQGYENITEAERASGNMKKISELKEKFPNLKYRRSSLYTMMVHNTERAHWNVIAKSFGNSKIPEKYNDHNIGPYLLETNLKKDSLVTYIDQYIKDEGVAKKLVARWFNRSAEGGFDMNLIAERGSYNASDLDLKIAQSSKRGLALLADAGEELLQNTFTIINDYKFLSLEDATALMQEIADTGSNASGIGGSLLGEAKSNAFSSAGDITSVAGELVKGYVVLSTSYLYKLEWTDSVSAVFYEQYWNEDGAIDPAKKEAFESSNIFSLKKVGFQSDFQIIPNLLTEKSYPELISIATQKATDKAMAKLQRSYEEFKTKTPLYGTDPLIAKIGAKEGLKKKDKFEVLEQILDNEGRTRYKRKGVLTVDESKIWDNTYTDEPKDNEDTERVATEFKGSSKGLYAGMLLRQIK